MIFIKEINSQSNENHSFIDAITDFIKANKEISSTTIFEENIQQIKNSRFNDYLFDELRNEKTFKDDNEIDDFINTLTVAKALELFMKYFKVLKVSFIIVNDDCLVFSTVSEYEIKCVDKLKESEKDCYLNGLRRVG